MFNNQLDGGKKCATYMFGWGRGTGTDPGGASEEGWDDEAVDDAEAVEGWGGGLGAIGSGCPDPDGCG
jgi:hypothetical protein